MLNVVKTVFEDSESSVTANFLISSLRGRNSGVKHFKIVNFKKKNIFTKIL